MYSSPYKKRTFHQVGTVLGTRLIDCQIYLCSNTFGKEYKYLIFARFFTIQSGPENRRARSMRILIENTYFVAS
jgi:hypothetical protein